MYDDTAQGGMDNQGANEESLRMVSANAIGNEPVSDEELRPHILDGFIGQPRLKAQLPCDIRPRHPARR